MIRIRKFIFKSGTRILKKIESRCSRKGESTAEEKVSTVSELRITSPLIILLKVSAQLNQYIAILCLKKIKEVKNKKIIDKIKEIFINNKKRYSYRRIIIT